MMYFSSQTVSRYLRKYRDTRSVHSRGLACSHGQGIWGASQRTNLVSAAKGTGYACRDTGGGESASPLVLFQHFRGNLDNWDPALTDSRASAPRVVTPG